MGTGIVCCGNRVDTPFCPTCGKSLRGPKPVDVLLCIAKNALNGSTTRLQNSKRLQEKYEEMDTELCANESIKRYQANVDKWQRTLEWLEQKKLEEQVEGGE